MSTMHNPLSPLPIYPGTTPRFHAMVKPTGAICNLDCAYCYYLHKEELLGSNSKFRISDEILETHIRQYIEAQRGDEVVFSWQGGEPTLLGVEFFEKVVALEKKYQRPGQQIENDLQTNGTLLNDEWYAFLRKNKFLVGLSIDGPQELHDRYRVNKGGKPTFDKVFSAGLQLQKHGIPFNTLTVVNRVNAKKPLDVYRFLTRELRPRQLQFIPCVEPKVFHNVAPQKWDLATLPLQNSPAAHPGSPDSVVTDWSVDPDDWGHFLCKVWDDWYRRDYGKVHVNLFETAVAQWMGHDAQLCVYSEFCGKGVALEHDGSRVLLRPLRVSRIQAGQHRGNARVPDGFFRPAEEVRIRQARRSPSTVPRMQVQIRLLGRVSQEPADSYPRRRARTELPVQRTTAVLEAHRSRHERHYPAGGASWNPSQPPEVSRVEELEPVLASRRRKRSRE